MVAKPCVSSKTMAQMATSSSNGTCANFQSVQNAYPVAAPPSVNHKRSVRSETIQLARRAVAGTSRAVVAISDSSPLAPAQYLDVEKRFRVLESERSRILFLLPGT